MITLRIRLISFPFLFWMAFMHIPSLSAPIGDPTTPSATLVQVAESDALWTGIAVSKEGRIFVCYPRWGMPIPASVSELSPQGDAIPYPNTRWNSWSLHLPASDYFTCIQSVHVDRRNDLWILDSGRETEGHVLSGSPKLLKVDLTTNTIVRTYSLEPAIATSGSYPNDVRVDTAKNIAYITDSGAGAIIVVDLVTGHSRRLLSEHPSTKSENIVLTIEGKQFPQQVHADGLALEPKGEYLYYQALSGRTLYRVRTSALLDTSLSEAQVGEAVERVARTCAADAIEFDRDGNLYITAIEQNAICKYAPATRSGHTPEGELTRVVHDARLKWPDSFSVTPDGVIYLTTSQIHLWSGRTEPYRVFRLDVQ